MKADTEISLSMALAGFGLYVEAIKNGRDATKTYENIMKDFDTLAANAKVLFENLLEDYHDTVSGNNADNQGLPGKKL